jgi:hypothetical protein
MPFDSTIFARQFRHWLLHCLVNALPSLAIALGWMQLIRFPAAVLAMFAAIGTFVLIYSLATTLLAPLHDPGHLLSRALHLGTRIRAWISAISLLVVPTGVFTMFTPDYWCGLGAIWSVNGTVSILTRSNDSFFDWESGPGFLATYLVTLVEGGLLSFLLLMISFFALVVLQTRERRKGFARKPR